MVVGFAFRHDLKARWADSTARVASLGEAPAHCQSVDWVCGEFTSKVMSVVTSLPSIQRGL